MIKGKSITSKRESVPECRVDYRKIDALNVSSIKCYDTDPVKFYREFILKQKRADKKSTSLIIGDLADFYLLDCRGDDEEFENRFHDKFALYEGAKGTGQVFTLADKLYSVTETSLNSMGEVVISFEDRFKDAYDFMIHQGFYKGKTLEKVLEDFNDKGKDYFQTLLDNSCKIVVEVSLVDKSKKVATMLATDPFTEEVFKEGDMDYLPKFPIEWEYTTQSGKVIKCKSEVDILKICHKEKKIYLKDLKTTYDNENFEYSYLKFRYDLQAAFYYLALEYWRKQEGMVDYTVEPMEFIVGDTSANNRRPVRFQTTLSDLDAGLNGCTIRGNRYKGIHELIDEISWAEDNDIWNASKELCDNNGIMQLNLNYD